MKARERFHAKKLRWFRAGAEDFAQVFTAAVLPKGWTSAYACPLCATREKVTVFAESAIGELTMEDVPPRHSDGRRLVLTCARCNNTAGHTVDAAAARQAERNGFELGDGARVVSIEASGLQVKATLTLTNHGKDGLFNVHRSNSAEALNAIAALAPTLFAGSGRLSFSYEFDFRKELEVIS